MAMDRFTRMAAQRHERALLALQEELLATSVGERDAMKVEYRRLHAEWLEVKSGAAA
jgi:hypothetical protein